MTDQPAPTPPADAHGPIRAKLGRRWVLKMTVFTFALFVLGAWGLYDATVVYPARGERYAGWAKWQYLLAAKAANDGGEFGIMARETSVPDPRGEYDRLRDPSTKGRLDTDAGSTNARTRLRAEFERTRLRWLESLATINRLQPERTVIEEPTQELDRLTAEWSTSTAQPKPLAWYDMPTQWIFTVVGFVGGLLLLAHMLRVAARKYLWHPAEKRLVVPGGHAITPADLVEVDKTRWDKFIVYMVLKDTHPTLPGGRVRVDTYQHADAEPWILEMESIAFPGQQEAEDRPSDAEPAASSVGEPPSEAGA